MKVLAFDTSSKALSLAILEDKQVLAETTINIKKNHSITLMPAIDFLMASLDWTPKDLDRIVVAEGPGSYTGLRIAVATAKTLAHTLNIELVGMSSLLALVPRQQEGLLVPLMDARRNNVYAGFYENAKPVMPEAHLSFAEVLEKVTDAEQVTFVGEVGPFVEQIQEQLPQASYQESLPNAANLALWAWDKKADSLHDFVPNYLKRVEAEENWLKNHTESGEPYIKRL
ncbi:MULTISPECIES: tRNA (adenosine(37)-N6)-threonylcarbamoyltransferase complex dimerization subunit type 1 TsaB [Streptococcus]|uniref:tRNA (Adenosine(37)-N6)-threonylcarbamoyltransferase complex dimerization subunit type 1 TsaB n=1 Tax=Streptococcus oralis subsp. oralis TaxID=1891914 RepID=A0A7H9FH46_STROR|nr:MULTISPECIES: tRNA (adenosine(37)-N6)-threonylcarbamoyltransferase complex dimerization subunit type 1 TsaB [Streptococcus]ANR75120.1 tRNA N6-adenosine(37)-N6-threonylcarbamoyltransferase complex dimerization subunit TsaB [Streptococcus sp. oral taxon 064]MCY7094866.1 tRNA (adenosine(37)-N6)-threonylcarbamoyltransferase complex dimerization subunit type 1 TsaB [Streptococcus oralis]QLL97914.1 tRNA (adenosine(37)-N6)-threonylcarbamoyltransferase complex dimerization subunit type 1 TsaB [Strept